MFNPPSSGGGGDVSNPVTTSLTYNDNIAALFGTGADASLAFRTTGAGVSTNVTYLGLGKLLAIGLKANSEFDFVGTDASAFFPDPTVIFLSSAQKANEFMMAGLQTATRNFYFTASGGDTVAGTQSNDNGIGFNFQGSNGGTLTTGGDGGSIAFTAGDGGGTTGDGGSFSVELGEKAGSGTDGTFSIRKGASQFMNIGATGSYSFGLTDNLSTALDISQSSDSYLRITTLDGSESLNIGNATTNPVFTFLGTGKVQFGGGNIELGHSAGNTAACHLVAYQYTDTTVAVNTGTLNAGGGSGASATLVANSSDIAGKLTVTAGNGTPTAGVIATITFDRAYNNVGESAIPMVCAASSTVAALGLYVTNVSSTAFDIATTTAFAADLVAVINYHVIGTN